MTQTDLIERGLLKDVRVTTREAARLENVSIRTVQRWVNNNEIEHGYDGGRYVVTYAGRVKKTHISVHETEILGKMKLTKY